MAPKSIRGENVAKMESYTWGLLGPEHIAIERRTRTLNLGACVRAFNDLAVPGFGGVWFGKQLFMATLGIAIAERVRQSGKRVTNIEVANAVEALGCWLALDHNKWQSDPRVRGATKMRLRSDLAFAQVRKPSFYVTQPMRQATIQPLRAFGLVESSGERFNGFKCSTIGDEFIHEVCGEYRPSNRSVLEHLIRWVKGDDVSIRTNELRNCLSPIEPMTKHSRAFLLERSITGSADEATRRRNANRWIEQRRANPQVPVDWDLKPAMIDIDHWRNLHVGSLFFKARDHAIAVLDHIEVFLGTLSDQRLPLNKPLPEVVSQHCDTLQNAVRDFLAENYDPSADFAATAFCRECNESSNSQIIQNLLSREGRVLQQKGNDVVPGSAYKGQLAIANTARSEEEGGGETSIPNEIQWPDGISHRVRNLFLFNLDMRGELDSWLAPSSVSGDLL